MELVEAIKRRRSVRRFKKKPVERDNIDKLISAANWAPSAGNLQARDFIIITDNSIKEKLSIVAHKSFISDAPLIIVVCANPLKSRKYGTRGEELYCIQDATASIQNILLTATSLGLGSCWVGAFDEGEVSKILKIPPPLRPIAILPIGYPDEEPVAPPRNIDIHQNQW